MSVAKNMKVIGNRNQATGRSTRSRRASKDVDETTQSLAAAKGKQRRDPFDLEKTLSGHGVGQSRLRFAAGQLIYTQGGQGEAAFYIKSGWVKISSVSPNGKEAVVAIRGAGEYFGTRCLVTQRMGTAAALSACDLVRVTTAALTRLLRENPDFAVIFATYLVRQSIKDQETLVHYLTNPAEKRLARVLLQLADNVEGSDAQPVRTPINQAMLANMIGTTRPRVSFFMNKFKRQGFVEYDREGHLSVRGGLRKFLAGA
jgi:CRP/FNR family transcriptional regulator, cyclic AMP receptor protein